MKNITLQVVVISVIVLSGCSSNPETPVPVDATDKVATESASPAEVAPLLPESAEAPPLEPPADLIEDPPVSTSKAKSIPEVLEEVNEAEAMSGAGAKAGGLAANPAYEKLRVKLTELGYEGVGLEHEPTAVLNLLASIFSDPSMAKRKIKRVYTGGTMEYDARAQAVTIGGSTNKAKILTFLKKKVPRR